MSWTSLRRFTAALTSVSVDSGPMKPHRKSASWIAWGTSAWAVHSRANPFGTRPSPIARTSGSRTGAKMIFGSGIAVAPSRETMSDDRRRHHARSAGPPQLVGTPCHAEGFVTRKILVMVVGTRVGRSFDARPGDRRRGVHRLDTRTAPARARGHRDRHRQHQ